MTPTSSALGDARRLHARAAHLSGAAGRPAPPRGAADRLRRAYRAGYWRTRFAREARAATGEYGPEVERLWGVPLRRQLAQQLALALRLGFDAEMYYRYRLYTLADLRDAAAFVPDTTYILLRRRAADLMGYDFATTEDKRAFDARCRDEGIATAPSVADVEGGDVAWGPAATGGAGDTRLPARDLFSKPAVGSGGVGVALWEWDGEAYAGGGLGEPPRRLAPDALVDHLRAQDEPHVLQPRLRNVPALNALTSDPLCTVRVVTVRVAGGEPEHVVSVLRMSAGDAAVDNFDQGGLAAPVDPATGALGVAVRKPLEFAARDYATHPVTGGAIPGFRVPQWDEVLALALRSHRAFAEALIVGWDIAVTTDGVVMVEANSSPGVRLGQQPGHRPLGTTAFARAYLSALDPA